MRAFRLALAALVIAAGIGPVLSWAQDEATEPPPAETPLPPELEPPDDSDADLENEAKTPDGAERVRQRLAEQFNVEPETISELRDQNLGFGEIDHALTLANQLPGGATQENIDQIMTMRQEQGMGWGQIAHELDTTLGAAKRAPIQEPAPTEPPGAEPSAGTETAGTATSATTEAQSLIRSGSAPGSQGKAKGKGFGGGVGTSAASGIERPGGGNMRGAGRPAHAGGGAGAARGFSPSGGRGPGGGGRGKSGSAPGHHR